MNTFEDQFYLVNYVRYHNLEWTKVEPTYFHNGTPTEFMLG